MTFRALTLRLKVLPRYAYAQKLDVYDSNSDHGLNGIVLHTSAHHPLRLVGPPPLHHHHHHKPAKYGQRGEVAKGDIRSPTFSALDYCRPIRQPLLTCHTVFACLYHAFASCQSSPLPETKNRNFPFQDLVEKGIECDLPEGKLSAPEQRTKRSAAKRTLPVEIEEYTIIIGENTLIP
ncbi:hypothetical protein OSTOST_04928, partial [Ostertagia ostertagi]